MACLRAPSSFTHLLVPHRCADTARRVADGSGQPARPAARRVRTHRAYTPLVVAFAPLGGSPCAVRVTNPSQQYDTTHLNSLIYVRASVRGSSWSPPHSRA